jgi:translation initiation factor 4G
MFSCRYDRDFLMQFMDICKEKPLTLSPLDVLGIAPIDPSSCAMVRGGHGRHRNPSTAMAPTANRQSSVGLGICGFQRPSDESPFQMGNFQSTGSRLTSEERFALSSAVMPMAMAGSARAVNVVRSTVVLTRQRCPNRNRGLPSNHLALYHRALTSNPSHPLKCLPTI